MLMEHYHFYSFINAVDGKYAAWSMESTELLQGLKIIIDGITSTWHHNNTVINLNTNQKCPSAKDDFGSLWFESVSVNSLI